MLSELGLYRRCREDPEVAWRGLSSWLPQVVRVLAPTKGYGTDRLPATGGAVVVANHLNGADPLFVGAHARRTIYFLAKAELLDIPAVGGLLRWVGAFGVRRGEGDRDALRVARWLVREGHVVGFFAEGTRQRLGYPGAVLPGAAMVAIHEGVPVVPCGVDTFRWGPANRRPCAIVWGDPLELGHLPTTGVGYRQASALIERRLHPLWRTAAQAASAGLPARLPDGAKGLAPLRGSERAWADSGRAWPNEPWAWRPLGRVHGG